MQMAEAAFTPLCMLDRGKRSESARIKTSAQGYKWVNQAFFLLCSVILTATDMQTAATDMQVTVTDMRTTATHM